MALSFLSSKESFLSRSPEIKFDNSDPTISIPALPLLNELPATGNLDIVPTPYKQLDWNGGFRMYKGIAIFDGVTQALREARISIYDPVKYFTLKSLYVAGFIQSQGAALVESAFTLTAIGTKINGQTVSKDFNYTPKGLRQFTLPNSFTGLKSVVFKTDLLTTLLKAVALDNVEYTVYTC